MTDKILTQVNGKNVTLGEDEKTGFLGDLFCRSCAFCYVTQKKQGMRPEQAFCRINPPTAAIMPAPGGQIAFVKVLPPIEPDVDWCGKHLHIDSALGKGEFDMVFETVDSQPGG